MAGRTFLGRGEQFYVRCCAECGVGVVGLVVGFLYSVYEGFLKGEVGFLCFLFLFFRARFLVVVCCCVGRN